MIREKAMLHFDSDYMEGAHPKILAYLSQLNTCQLPGYGEDRICESAREKIRCACGCPDAEIHFLSGGTQTNMVVIRSLLKLYEGVVAAETGHVNVHEAGAIEASGHKVLSLPSHMGKLDPAEVEAYLTTFSKDENRAHMVRPGMVYISHPTEFGTLYTRDELESLHAVCRRFGFRLSVDGARPGCGLAARHTDVTLPVLAASCDVFYIGGTKVGAMFGEAVVFPKSLVPGFFTMTKTCGALLAKGWMLGAQFDVLFTDDLYMECGRHAIDMAEQLKAGLAAKGCRFAIDSPTNQQFLILSNKKMETLSDKVSFCYWEPHGGDETVVRAATSWATKAEDVEALIDLF